MRASVVAPPFSGPPPRITVILFLLLLPSFSGTGALAQSVEGRVLDRDSGEPVQGAMVLLLGEEEEVHSGFLTDPEGRFSLQAPEAGPFRVRAELIGFKTVSVEIEVEGSQPLSLDILTERAPLSLEGLVISGGSRCLVRPDEGLRVARVWEEARKALANQEWTSRGGFLKYQVVRYRTELDRSGLPLEERDREVASLVGETPIRSLPAEDLLANGYIRKVSEGAYDYFGPDARVLLSDPFLDTHCFRLVEDEDHPESIGLAFRPVQRRALPDIQGTFWVDRDGGTLRLLEYSFTRLPWTEAQGVARGRVEFEGLPTGAWVIRRWWIRMPLMVLDHAVRRLGGEGLRVAGILEEGGEVTKISFLRGGQIVDNVTAQVEEEEPPQGGR